MSSSIRLLGDDSMSLTLCLFLKKYMGSNRTLCFRDSQYTGGRQFQITSCLN